ncbi:MAG: YraN family protein [Candidatus Omnitrophota bacterium]
MQKGKVYEDKAARFLELKGYKILCRNWRARYGEIDVIARDGAYTVFLEVKARARNCNVSGLEALSAAKRHRIVKTALLYTAGAPDASYRFDVLEIIHGKDCLEYNLIKDAFRMNE